MKTFLKFFLSLIWLLWCTAIFLFHLGTLTPPQSLSLSQSQNLKVSGQAQLFNKTSEHQIQHLVLSGSPYSRGYKAGELTRKQLFQQEVELFAVFEKIFPFKSLSLIFELVLIPIFHGIDQVIPQKFLLEMYGVSRWTEPDYDHYAEPYTRQLAYHGLHEVGQIMVDQIQDDRIDGMACTAVVIPHGKSWIVGRNFDFEGGPTLDVDKIIKWVFPDQGHAFVSVIWAGMVGAVTAVNDQGLFMSINAANSDDFNRHGLPSTLLVTEVMESAKNAEEAIDVLKKSSLMITDIFLLVDSQNGKAFRIEKSPSHTAIHPITDASSITNHLIDDFWKNDHVNTLRRDNLTSLYRMERATELIAKFKETKINDIEMEVLKILRDKKALHNELLSLGNRRAINALIANHGVIFNGLSQTLYVSRGPHLNQAFEGFNLTESFQQKKPVFAKTLPPDPELTESQYHDFKNYNFILQTAKKYLKGQNNDAFLNAIKEAENLISKDSRLEDSMLYDLQAQFFKNTQDLRQSKVFAQKALDLKPAYKRDEDRLKELLK